MQNYYDVLGVQENASADEIQRSYRTLSLQYHPDRNPRGTAMFKSVQQAFEVLSDPGRRSAHDAQLRAERAKYASCNPGHSGFSRRHARSPFGGGEFPFAGRSRYSARPYSFHDDTIGLDMDDDSCVIVLDESDDDDLSR